MEFEVETYRVRIKGAKPGLLLNNAQTADPDNEYAIQLQELKTRAKNSSEAAKQRSIVEYLGCLYTASFPEGERVVLPQAMLSRVLYGGAVKVDQKKGKGWSNGLTVTDSARLIYDGPQNIDDLSRDYNWVLKAPVKQGQVTIVRTRPFFRQWSAEFEVELELDFCTPDILRRIIAIACRQIGLGDWRPERGKGGKHGRFTLESFEKVEELEELAEAA